MQAFLQQSHIMQILQPLNVSLVPNFVCLAQIHPHVSNVFYHIIYIIQDVFILVHLAPTLIQI